MVAVSGISVMLFGLDGGASWDSIHSKAQRGNRGELELGTVDS